MGSQSSHNDGGSNPFWDFINNHVPMDDIPGPQAKESEKPQSTVEEEPANDPLHSYLPHNHKKVWKMLQQGKDRSQPEKVEEAERFFRNCPDGSCRQTVRDTLRNVGFYNWKDAEYETYDGN